MNYALATPKTLVFVLTIGLHLYWY